MNVKYYSNELCHFGIKGQRWGIRRYQNEDGSLTEEGKRRYGYEGELKTQGVKEYAKDRRKRIKAEAEAIKKSKVSNFEKAQALAKLGAHKDANEAYRRENRRSTIAYSLNKVAYYAGARVASKILTEKAKSGKMSYEQAERIGHAASIGKNIVDAYLLAKIGISASKANKEYWKPDYE
jgi:hypothetical protein